MKKSDLEDGAILILRDGSVCIKINNCIINSNGDYCSLDRYGEDLKHINPKANRYDVMKVANYGVESVQGHVKYKNYNWVREEKLKLTVREIELLKALKVLDFNSIARDQNGDLNVFKSTRIVKHSNEWISAGLTSPTHIMIDEDEFQFIKWEDEEPYSIRNLLKEYE